MRNAMKRWMNDLSQHFPEIDKKVMEELLDSRSGTFYMHNSHMCKRIIQICKFHSVKLICLTDMFAVTFSN